jgi:hypothetical protein
VTTGGKKRQLFLKKKFDRFAKWGLSPGFLGPGGADGVLAPVCALLPTANVYTRFLGKLGKKRGCAKLTRKDPQQSASSRKDPQLFWKE